MRTPCRPCTDHTFDGLGRQTCYQTCQKLLVYRTEYIDQMDPYARQAVDCNIDYDFLFEVIEDT